MKILIAEDDKDLGSVLREYLILKGYEVTLAENGQLALEAFHSCQPDICVFDVMMPVMDGFTLAQKVMGLNPDMPFVFLTARAMQEDKLKGLGMGAADYITKPFDPEELIIRLQNILKRYQLAESTDLVISDTKLDVNTLTLHCCGNKHILTDKEAKLIDYLFNHKNTIVSRQEVLNAIWGESDFFVGRSMDVFISRIRKCLAKDTGINIRTVRGKGFIMELNS